MHVQAFGYMYYSQSHTYRVRLLTMHFANHLQKKTIYRFIYSNVFSELFLMEVNPKVLFF